MMNKIAPSNFDALAGKFIAERHERMAGEDYRETTETIARTLHRRAVAEPGFLGLYVSLCLRLSADMPSLLSCLVDACQRAFESGPRARADVLYRSHGTAAAAAAAERVCRQRACGNARVIAELVHRHALPVAIATRVLSSLLRLDGSPDTAVAPEDVETGCALLRGAGREMDAAAADCVDAAAARLAGLAGSPGVASRLKFMAQDVLEIRANGWAPRKPPAALAARAHVDRRRLRGAA